MALGCVVFVAGTFWSLATPGQGRSLAWVAPMAPFVIAAFGGGFLLLVTMLLRGARIVAVATLRFHAGAVVVRRRGILNLPKRGVRLDATMPIDIRVTLYDHSTDKRKNPAVEISVGQADTWHLLTRSSVHESARDLDWQRWASEEFGETVRVRLTLNDNT